MHWGVQGFKEIHYLVKILKIYGKEDVFLKDWVGLATTRWSDSGERRQMEETCPPLGILVPCDVQGPVKVQSAITFSLPAGMMKEPLKKGRKHEHSRVLEEEKP